jgi:hypothetical protein
VNGANVVAQRKFVGNEIVTIHAAFVSSETKNAVSHACLPA